MDGPHIGEYISELCLGLMEEWGVARDYVSLVLRDNQSNMIKGMHVAELTDVSCCAHTLQLVVNSGKTSQRVVMNVIAMLKTCGNHVSHSIPAKNWRKEIQKDLELPEHALIQATPTLEFNTAHVS